MVQVHITVEVNGRAREAESGATIATLLAEAGIPADGIAVAKNDHVVRRTEFDTERIESGDRIEIIRAVAGG